MVVLGARPANMIKERCWFSALQWARALLTGSFHRQARSPKSAPGSESPRRRSGGRAAGWFGPFMTAKGALDLRLRRPCRARSRSCDWTGMPCRTVGREATGPGYYRCRSCRVSPDESATTEVGEGFFPFGDFLRSLQGNLYLYQCNITYSNTQYIGLLDPNWA
jgi:hypothetical protein